MKVVPFVYGDREELFANCYLAIDESSSCVVIDPSCDYDGVINYIRKNNLKCKGVLLTHAHFDHMRGIDRTVAAFDVPFFVSRDDEDGLTNSEINCSTLSKHDVIIKTKARVVDDQEVLNLLDEPIKVISTPFHTKGSICYYIATNNIIFTGDTLFRGFIGRTDLPSSIARETKSSLAKLLALPDETKVYPGHGLTTNIGFERKLNPFIK
ncbi:MAG: MBL fold metallo-hydrolase [Bacilli bacterium]|jgi:hydroxyacylglutathione hydrolase|nr:MBL fold metallo-hydrolase [Bacilli bacterium]